VTVIGDGRQTRCFTYVSDAVRATVAAGLRPAAIGGVFNVGTDRETSIRELAERLVALSGSRSRIEYVRKEDVYGPGYEDIERRVPDLSRMREILGVTPEVSLEEGLRRTIEYFRRELASNP
jgi:UDP-glucose 4-epimerase